MHRRLAAFLAIAVLVAMAPSGARAQAARTANNAVYLELGGNGLLYSLNYERVLPSDVAFRGGFGYLSVSATAGDGSGNASVLMIPLTFSYLGIGGGSARFELGAGATFARFSASASSGFGDDIKAGAFVPVPTGIVALRLAPPGGGFNFKLAYTPFWNGDIGFFHWGGLALGAGF